MAAKPFINDKVKGKMKQNHDSSQSASQSEGAVAEGGKCCGLPRLSTFCTSRLLILCLQGLKFLVGGMPFRSKLKSLVQVAGSWSAENLACHSSACDAKQPLLNGWDCIKTKDPKTLWPADCLNSCAFSWLPARQLASNDGGTTAGGGRSIRRSPTSAR